MFAETLDGHIPYVQALERSIGGGVLRQDAMGMVVGRAVAGDAQVLDHDVVRILDRDPRSLAGVDEGPSCFKGTESNGRIRKAGIFGGKLDLALEFFARLQENTIPGLEASRIDPFE